MTSRYRVPIEDLEQDAQVAAADRSTAQPVRDAVPAPPLVDPPPHGGGGGDDGDGD